MSPDNSTSRPTTPRAANPIQALSNLFRTPTRLSAPTTLSRRNKRTHHRMSSLSSTPSSTPGTPSLPAVILQTYSLSTDSIILTTLPSVPFCCHEDLLTMSRAQLEGVVRALNTQLPRRMRISPEDDFWQDDDQQHTEECDGDTEELSRMSEAEIRKRIEELVGIRPVVGKNRVPRSGLGLESRTRVPPAPKAVRTRDTEWQPHEKAPWETDVDATVDQIDGSNTIIEDVLIGSSPLAGRTKSSTHFRGKNGMLSRLAILQEENESNQDDSEDSEIRPSKRQRVSTGSIAHHSKEGSHTVQERTESRLVENMDLSGSPLLAGEDDLLPDNVIESDERITTATNPGEGVKAPKEDVQLPLQCRRSARIQEVALKRASSADMGRETTLGTRNPKSSSLPPNTLSSRCSSPRNISTMTGEYNIGSDPGKPREFNIRLPFTSTPPQEKPDSSVWSAPHILRSHSQRILKSSNFTKTTAMLGRSQSNKYPRATDLAFVTIDRPRYRFVRRKSKVTNVAKVDQELCPSMSASPVRSSCRQSGVEGKHKNDKDLKAVNGNPPKSNLHNLPSTLRSFLTPRSRAPSTSTVTSTQGNVNDSPVQTTLGNFTAPTAFADPMVNDSTTECVWKALGRMAVDPQ